MTEVTRGMYATSNEHVFPDIFFFVPASSFFRFKVLKENLIKLA